MKDLRTAAAIATAIVAVLIVVLLLAVRISVDARTWPPTPRSATALVEAEEEFVEFFDPMPVSANPSPAYSETKAGNESSPAKADGTDITDAGEAAVAMPDVASGRPSAVERPKKETPKKSGPDKKAAEEERARRKARQGVSNAFQASEESADNTNSKGAERGDSGSPDGSASDVDGSGTGTVGGGWIMPKYAKVPSMRTGSIELRAIVDREGRVVSVELVGGKAPASGDPALVERCKAEVRRHRFTRNDDNAPERSTARIRYFFK